MAASSEIAKSTKIKLNDLSCPFTWELHQIAVMYHEIGRQYIRGDTIEYTDEDILILVLIPALLKCYESVLSADMDTAEKKLHAAEACLESIQQSKESPNIIRTIEHIVYATKCHFLYEANNEQELENVLQDIVDVSDFTDEEQGALCGCKSTAFYYYYDYGEDKAIDAATIAVEKNADNALWHVILAKCLRRKRRRVLVGSVPSQLECEHFETAFLLSKSPDYGICFARMKHESLYKKWKWSEENELIKTENLILHAYKLILDSDTRKWRIMLKMALGFLRIRTSDQTTQAERCLDIVDEECPNNSTSLHYRGMLHRRRGNKQEALQFFKQSADLHNYIADIQYAEYGVQIGCVDPLEHFLSIQTKYSNAVAVRQQELLLHTATCYYIFRHDQYNAAITYLNAIDVDPGSSKLTCFYKFHTVYEEFGIYRFLQRTFLPSFKQKKINARIRDVIDQLHERCRTHFNKATEDVAGLLDSVKI